MRDGKDIKHITNNRIYEVRAWIKHTAPLTPDFDYIEVRVGTSNGGPDSSMPVADTHVLSFQGILPYLETVLSKAKAGEYPFVYCP